MNGYEALFIVKPQLGESQVEEYIKKYTSMIEKKQGKVYKAETWGLKTLAYEIKKCSQGYYIQFHFTGEQSFIKEMENSFNLDENIIRYIVVKLNPEEVSNYQTDDNQGE